MRRETVDVPGLEAGGPLRVRQVVHDDGLPTDRYDWRCDDCGREGDAGGLLAATTRALLHSC